MFPITEFDGVTACILLFAAMTASNELRSIESSRNERIAVLASERKEALDAAAVLPVAEAPQPPPQPPTAFDPFSRGVLANAFGCALLMVLAAAFRISQPLYEEAVLSGRAGVYLLVSCAAAAVNAVAVAVSDHNGGIRPVDGGCKKKVWVSSAMRALIIVVSWHVAAVAQPSVTSVVGVAICIAALVATEKCN
jgi:hypothetical protein